MPDPSQQWFFLDSRSSALAGRASYDELPTLPSQLLNGASLQRRISKWIYPSPHVVNLQGITGHSAIPIPGNILNSAMTFGGGRCGLSKQETALASQPKYQPVTSDQPSFRALLSPLLSCATIKPRPFVYIQELHTSNHSKLLSPHAQSN